MTKTNAYKSYLIAWIIYIVIQSVFLILGADMEITIYCLIAVAVVYILSAGYNESKEKND